MLPMADMIPGRGEFPGIMAGKGMEGAGEADRRMDGEEPKEDLRE